MRGLCVRCRARPQPPRSACDVYNRSHRAEHASRATGIQLCRACRLVYQGAWQLSLGPVPRAQTHSSVALPLRIQQCRNICLTASGSL